MAGSERESRKSVIAALLANTGIAIAKFVAAAISGSSSMLAEAFHSLADTGNQGLLLFGLARAKRPADEGHPFGHGKARFFWGLIVAVSLFMVGGGFSVYHGVKGLVEGHQEVPDVTIALIVIGVAVCFEGYAWRTAWKQLDASRRGRGVWAALRHSKDPEVLTVLAEDTAAISGLLVAAAGVSLAALTGEAAFDSAGSVIIGLILLAVAFLLGRENAALLIGEAVDPQVRQDIDRAIRSIDEVEGVFELLTMHLGPDEFLVVADVQFRDDLDTEDIATTIDRVEAAIREAAPGASRIYVEPEIRGREPAPARRSGGR
jgi:cation diffusion facilitator family transporter